MAMCKTIDPLAAALREPARPLFLGRKTCLPAAPVLRAMVEAPDVLAALQQTPSETHAGRTIEITASACWPVQLGVELPGRVVAVYDQRDWRNQIHTGRRLRREGLLHTQEAG
jgi:CRISPR system Cascade subunit CasD